jgi:hypothetical protein
LIETLGNIGDFLGGLGVLVTLVYLSLQIRQNTIATRTNSYQDVVTAMSEWSRNVGSDPDLCRLLNRGGVSYDDLDPTERLQFNFVMGAYFRNMESIHAKFASGAIEPDVWDGWANRLLALLAGRGVAEWWKLNESGFDPRFRSAIRNASPSEGLPESFDSPVA